MEETPIKYKVNADPANFLDPWKWFADEAIKIKDTMWTMTTFFTPCWVLCWVLWENN